VNPRIGIVAASAFFAACGASAADAAVEIDTEFDFVGAAISRTTPISQKRHQSPLAL
jgi:hypothetical protein